MRQSVGKTEFLDPTSPRCKFAKSETRRLIVRLYIERQRGPARNARWYKWCLKPRGRTSS
eukprot:5891568-Prymnesium_polylepis.1